MWPVDKRPTITPGFDGGGVQKKSTWIDIGEDKLRKAMSFVADKTKWLTQPKPPVDDSWRTKTSPQVDETQKAINDMELWWEKEQRVTREQREQGFLPPPGQERMYGPDITGLVDTRPYKPTLAEQQATALSRGRFKQYGEIPLPTEPTPERVGKLEGWEQIGDLAATIYSSSRLQKAKEEGKTGWDFLEGELADEKSLLNATLIMSGVGIIPGEAMIAPSLKMAAAQLKPEAKAAALKLKKMATRGAEAVKPLARELATSEVGAIGKGAGKIPERIIVIDEQLAKLQKQYEKIMNEPRGAMVPPGITKDRLSGIAKRMDKLDQEKELLVKQTAPPPTAKPSELPQSFEMPGAGQGLKPDITSTMSEAYIQAKKRADGKWQLFFRGTRNEVFPNELYNSAEDARMAFKVAKAKAGEIPDLAKQAGQGLKAEVSTKIGNMTIKTSRGGVAKEYNVKGTFVGDDYFVASGAGGKAYGTTEKNYVVYDKSGKMVQGGFDKASDAIEHAKGLVKEAPAVTEVPKVTPAVTGAGKEIPVTPEAGKVTVKPSTTPVGDMSKQELEDYLKELGKIPERPFTPPGEVVPERTPGGVTEFTNQELQDALDRKFGKAPTPKPLEVKVPPVPPEKPPVKPTGDVPPGGGGIPPSGQPPITETPPTGKPKEPFAANIRLSKYPEDIRGVIKEWAEANPNVVQEARRGGRSDEQVLADAKKLVEEMGDNFEKLKRGWKAGQAWNSEELLAIRGTLRNKTEAVKAATDAVKAENTSANHAKLLLALEEQSRIQEMVHGVTAEAGRALRSFRQEVFNAIQGNDTLKLEALLKRYGGRDKLEDIADALSKLDINNPASVNSFIRNITKPKAMDYLTEIFYNSILSGPKTHIVNSLSNMLTSAISPLERGGAVMAEKVLAKLQGRAAERFWREVPADAVGAYQGIKEGVIAGLYTMKNGFNPAKASKWEFRPHAFKGWVGRLINVPSNALEAADAMNYAINYRGAINALATRTAKIEKLSGNAFTSRVADILSNPSKSLMDDANRIAEYRLFRQEPGKFTSHLIALRDTVPGLQFVIPFLRTPINLVKFGLERSPVGIINPSLWRNLAKKNPAAADQIARIGMGSTIAAAVALGFNEGKITGAAPTNSAERDRFYREGKQPFSVKIGDTWVQYQRIEPLNQSFSQVAAAVDAIKNKDKAVEDRVGQAVFTIAQNLVSQTYMSSLSNLLDAMNNPEREASTLAERLVQPLIVPASSATRTAAQIMDTTIRQPETFGERIQAGIPGLSQNVPSRLDVFGQEVKRQTPAISPINITKEQQTELDKELNRLKVNVGFVGDSIGRQKLDREQQRQYQLTAGQFSQNMLNAMVTAPFYKKLSDDDKEELITKIVNDSRDKARNVIVPGSFPKAEKKDIKYYEVLESIKDYDTTEDYLLKKKDPKFAAVWRKVQELESDKDETRRKQAQAYTAKHPEFKKFAGELEAHKMAYRLTYPEDSRFLEEWRGMNKITQKEAVDLYKRTGYKPLLNAYNKVDWKVYNK